MFILEYSGNSAAVIIDGGYIYRFESLSKAKELIDSSEGFFVQYPNRSQEIENSLANKQKLKVKNDGYTYNEL